MFSLLYATLRVVWGCRMRYTVWPDIDHITEEPWPTQGLYETFVGKLDAALESGLEIHEAAEDARSFPSR